MRGVEPLSKREQFNQEANERTEKFLRETLLQSITSDLSREIEYPVSITIDPDDPQTLRFEYPNSFSDYSILKEIRLEIGAHSTWTPAQPQTITSYAAQEYRHLFTQPSTEVFTILPERTFWEKVKILHKEAYRSEDKTLPIRYSRHYYVLYRMSKTTVKDKALSDAQLLDQVVRFKEKFY